MSQKISSEISNVLLILALKMETKRCHLPTSLHYAISHKIIITAMKTLNPQRRVCLRSIRINNALESYLLLNARAC